MPTELPGVPPLHGLLGLTEFSGEQLQGPDDHHLIVGARRQVLPARGEPHHVHCGGVPALQVIFVVRDPVTAGLISLRGLPFQLPEL